MLVGRIKNTAEARFNEMTDKKTGVLDDKIFLEINLGYKNLNSRWQLVVKYVLDL